jgi:UDP-glucose:(glucosyl)LPS alpha-1,2-glucosyltransferase
MLPRGGTELQHEFLNKYGDKSLLDQVQITTSIPEKIPLHPTKLNILWQKNSYDQPNIVPWMNVKENHKKYDWYVFNSHWNYEKFRMAFDIPTDRCHVIKNGAVAFLKRKPYKQGDPIRMLFHPTPWRGLNVILLAMQMVKNPLIKLDVYSSCQVYGDDFAAKNDHAYVELYKQAAELPNVNYIGYKPNEYILKNLENYHIFAFPSIWEETFCISALEAMGAGLFTIVTNYGALFETCAEFPVYINYQKDFTKLAEQFAHAIEGVAQELHTDGAYEHLQFQQKYVKRFYNWEGQAQKWNQFLQGALSARRK